MLVPEHTPRYHSHLQGAAGLPLANLALVFSSSESPMASGVRRTGDGPVSGPGPPGGPLLCLSSQVVKTQKEALAGSF